VDGKKRKEGRRVRGILGGYEGRVDEKMGSNEANCHEGISRALNQLMSVTHKVRALLLTVYGSLFHMGLPFNTS
jgi:hypothetical protein